MPEEKLPVRIGEECTRRLQTGKEVAVRVDAGPEGEPRFSIRLDGKSLYGQRLTIPESEELSHFLLEVVASASEQPDGWPFEQS